MDVLTTVRMSGKQAVTAACHSLAVCLQLSAPTPDRGSEKGEKMATQSSTDRQRQVQYLRELMARTGNPVLDGIRGFGSYLVRHPPLAQGGYYVVRGLWPLLGAAFFWSRAEVATFWYAQATGVLILAI